MAYGDKRDNRKIDLYVRKRGDKVRLDVEIIKSNYSQQWNTWYATAVTPDNRAVLEALKPDAFKTLQQAKQRIEQNRQQEVDQWAQDFRANSSKLAGQQLKQRFAEPPPEPPTMPVVQPGESPDALRDRLAQLNIAKQKFEEINALIRAIKKKYQHSAIEAEITAIERRLETGLLPDVRAGVADNYKSLLAKLDNLKTSLTTRFIVKEAPDYIDESKK